MKYFYAGIRVRDLERSLQFYRKVMGMRVTRRGKISHGGVWVELRNPGSPQRLELNWYPTNSKFFAPYRKGEELDHLAFRVTDVHGVFRELVANGARPEVAPFREERCSKKQ
ncbi:MAG TPA: VOC family protein [Thermoplasmata archaeon]|nr:VOC family protein [Thermoplasmata archaeon]